MQTIILLFLLEVHQTLIEVVPEIDLQNVEANDVYVHLKWYNDDGEQEVESVLFSFDFVFASEVRLVIERPNDDNVDWEIE